MSRPPAPPPGRGVGYLLARAAGVAPGDGWLTGAERRAQERFAIAHRRADWRLGRWVAKGALAAWSGGADPAGIGVLARGPDDGYPVVEGMEARAQVSISHRDGVALAVVGPLGPAVGGDLERVEPRPAGFAADWFTGAERAAVAAGPAPVRDLVVTVLWSAKESALKALGDGLRRDTREVEATIGLTPERGGWRRVGVEGPAGRRFEGWWRPCDQLVMVVVADAGGLAEPPRSLRSAWPAARAREVG